VTDARQEQTSTETSGKRNPAALIYVLVFAGAVLTTSILAVLGFAGIVSPIPDLPSVVLRVVGLVLLVLVFGVSGMVSGGIRPLAREQDEQDWWTENGSRAVATWALAEGLAVVGGVFWLLTGDLVILVGLGVGGVVILVLNRPGRMMEG